MEEQYPVVYTGNPKGNPFSKIQKKNSTKELSFCTNSDFRTPISFATLCHRPLIFQTMNYVRSNSQSLKYQRFTPSYYTDRGVRKFEFPAKSHFL